ncbi:MAG: IPT/TIG domain-containing protein [Planctomycetota bacterium]|nr:IPT/TIG domain-containing protein [Planctomycetota bacterium]
MKGSRGGIWVVVFTVAVVGMGLAGCSKKKLRTAKGPVPEVTDVAPASGPAGGGTGVTITGTHFQSDSQVEFGGRDAANVLYVSSTQLDVFSPPGAVGIVDVRVLNPSYGTTGSLPGSYTYTTGPGGGPAPTVTQVTPDRGPPTGGTPVTVDGSNFISGALLFVGGRPATSVIFVSPDQIAGTTPSGAPGPATVTVINPDLQTGVLPAGFTYTFTSGGIQITAITPSSGSTDGNTFISITGQGFAPGATATIGGVTVINLGFVSDSELTGLTPPSPGGATGPVDVIVTNPGGPSDTLVDGYDYVFAPIPTVANINPNVGDVDGGTPVTITGTNFLAGTVVSLDGVPIDNQMIVDVNTVTGETPPHAQPSVVDVDATNSFGTGTLPNGFTYVPLSGGAPYITAINPTSGPIGQRVVIDGVNFAPTEAGNVVRLDGEPSPVQTASETQLVVYVPPKGRTGDFRVEVDRLVSNGVLFTVTSPKITAILPDSGQVGDPITLIGENFSPVRSENVLRFNNYIAQVVLATTTQIDTWVPWDASAGAVWVEVNGVPSNAVFFCVQTPSVPWPRMMSMTPDSGPVGTTVTLTGEYFSPTIEDNAVWFNGLRAPVLTVNAADILNVIITAQVPAGATTGLAYVEVGGLYTVVFQETFTVTTPPPPPPVITRLSPVAGEQDSGLLIEGMNFNPEVYNNFVTINNAWAEVVTASPTQLLVRVPFTSSGLVIVDVAGQASIGQPFTVFPPAGGPQTIEIFGRQIPAPDDRVVYVIDTSSSMNIVFGDFVDRLGNTMTAGTEWDLLKDRMIQSISELPPSFSFTVIAFRGMNDPVTGDCVPVIIPFQGATVPASQANKDAAITWLDSLVPAGQTAMANAVETGLQSDPLNKTIILCTDGLWNCPPVSGAEHLCTMFNANTSGAAIHSFGIQVKGSEARVLSDISKLTGGTFTQIDP